MDSTGEESGREPGDAVPRSIWRFAVRVWKSLLTGVLGGLEATYFCWYFVRPFASVAWQEAAQFTSEHIYYGTPRLWLPLLIAALSVFYLAVGAT